MTNADILALYTGLSNINNYQGVRFNYAIAKNLKAAEKEVKILGEQEVKVRECLKDYEVARIDCLKSHAKKDENGNPIKLKEGTKDEKFDIVPVIMETLVSPALKKLEEDHKPALDEFKERIIEFNKLLLEENNDFKPFLIPQDILPESITTEHTKIIFPLIKED